MSTRAEELAYDLEAEVISHQVADEAAAELRRLAAEVESLREAIKEAATLADFAECWITDPSIEGVSRLKGRGAKFRKLLENPHG